MLRETNLCTGTVLAVLAVMMSASACGDDASTQMADAAAPGVDAGASDAAMADAATPDAVMADASGDIEAPAVAIAFPPALSLTDTDRVTVRGSAADESGVVAVRVSGVDATSDDGFATWRAEVPLVHGANTLVVESEDVHGNLDAGAATVTVERSSVLLGRVRGIAMDTAGDRFFVSDPGSDRVVAVDAASGERSVLTDATTGTGPALSSPFAMTWDAAGDRLLVADNGRILAVAPGTGDRTLISGSGTGTGPDLGSTIESVVIDDAAGRLLAADKGNSALVSVDLATGDRTIVSGGAVGSGPALSSLEGMALDRANGRALVIVGFALLAVDLATGDRTTVSDATTGTGPAFSVPHAVIVDATGATVWVVDSAGVYVVDAQTGDRTVLSDNTGNGTGSFFDAPTYGALDETRARLLIPQEYRSGVMAVDLATGDRSWTTSFYIGESDFWWTELGAAAVDPTFSYAIIADENTELPPDDRFSSVSRVDLATGDRVLVTQRGDFEEARDVVMDGQRVFVIDTDLPDVFTVDLDTGEVALLSGEQAGQGPALDFPFAAALDPASGALLVLDRGLGQIFAVDTQSGDRTVLSGGSVGTGPALDRPLDIALDQAGGRAFVSSATTNEILAVDLATGDRTLISDSSAGVALANPAQMAHDATRGRLLVTLYDVGLVAVDLATGARTLISGGAGGPGSGPSLRPSGVRVHEEAGIAWVTDIRLNALAVFDVLTGDRVIVSR